MQQTPMPDLGSIPVQVPRAQTAQPASLSEQAASPAITQAQAPSEIRKFLRERSSGGMADRSFAGLMVVCALSVIFIVLLIVFVLIANSRLSIHAFGWKFFKDSNWDPVNGSFGALPFIYGTLVSSLLALLIAVPLSIAVSIFLLDICPVPLRAPIAYLTELLAAIPSVVYGLWAIVVLVPIVRDQVGPLLERWFGWTGLFAEPNFGVGMFTASIVL